MAQVIKRYCGRTCDESVCGHKGYRPGSKPHPSCWLLPMSGDNDLVWNITKADKGCIYQPFEPSC
jgi:hypothetical protein